LRRQFTQKLAEAIGELVILPRRILNRQRYPLRRASADAHPFFGFTLQLPNSWVVSEFLDNNLMQSVKRPIKHVVNLRVYAFASVPRLPHRISRQVPSNQL